METPVQDQLQEAMTSTPTSMTEPLLLQLATPISPLTTPLDRIQPSLIAKPDNWNQMSASAQRKWRQAQNSKNKEVGRLFVKQLTIASLRSP